MIFASSKRLSQITTINYIWIRLLQIDLLLKSFENPFEGHG